jgi:hypothetical protein
MLHTCSIAKRSRIATMRASTSLFLRTILGFTKGVAEFTLR